MKPPDTIVRYSKPILYRTIGYRIFSPDVKAMHESHAKTKIMSAPARTSKSYSAAADVLPDCFPSFGIYDGKPYPMPSPRSVDGVKHIWIVAPHFSLAKEFDYLWHWLVEKRKRFGWSYELLRSIKSPDAGHMQIDLGFGPDIEGQEVKIQVQVKSEMNERSLQAEEVEVAILSEAADLQARTWKKYLSTRVGRSLWPTTPKPHADWIREEIELGASDPRLGIEHFSYDGRCNPTYEWERYWREHMKAESRQSSEAKTVPIDMMQPPSRNNGHECFAIGEACAASRDPHFGEQFMGRWTYAESRVLAFRWQSLGKRMSHILDLEPAWVAHADKYVSVDYGFTDAAAAVFFAVDADDTVVAFDEIYEKGLEPDRFCAAIHRRAKERGYQIKRYFSDPQKPEVMKYLQRLHLPVIRVDAKRQRDRQTGFMILQDYLSDDPLLERPKFFVMRQCQNGIREMRTLHRRDKHAGNEFSEEAMIGDDHWVSAARYFFTTFPRGSTLADKMVKERGKSLFEMARENQRHRSQNIRRGFMTGSSGVIH